MASTNPDERDTMLKPRRFSPRAASCRSRGSIKRTQVLIIVAVCLVTYGGLTLVRHVTVPSSKTFDPKLTALAEEYGQDNVANQFYAKHSKDYSWYSDVTRTVLNYTRLITPKNFSMSYRYVHVVHSRVKNRQLRDVIRKTWGRDVRHFGNSALVFFLGYDESRQKMTEDEAAKLNDIVQYSLEESYASLTKKSILMLEWANETLASDSFLVKSDDDILVNVFNLRRTLQTLGDVTPQFVAGKMISDTEPKRDPSDKWYVTRSEYSDDSYPPYFAGCLYVITGNLIDSMLRTTRTSKLTPMEDVYITGIVADKLNVIKLGLRGINSWENVTACDMHNQLAAHYMTAERLVEYHHLLRTTIRTCEFWLFVGGCRCVPSLEALVRR